MKNSNDEIAKLQNACRRAGLKLTPQRLEIFRELAQSRNHPSVEELHRRLLLKFPTMSLDTVYRTLGTFVRQGLVHKIESVESHGRYEVRGAPHHHLICRRCKEIVDFEWAFFDETALPDDLQSWGQIEDRSVIVHGLCSQCALEEE